LELKLFDLGLEDHEGGRERELSVCDKESNLWCGAERVECSSLARWGRSGREKSIKGNCPCVTSSDAASEVHTKKMKRETGIHRSLKCIDEIFGYHSGEYEDGCLLGYCAR
jgi:hypothetical protein